MILRLLILQFIVLAPFYCEAYSELSESDYTKLKQQGWEQRVGENLGIWVSAGRQKVIVVKCKKILMSTLCSTSSKGIGNRVNSNQTPIGWHLVAERIGNGLPWGAIFEERRYTGRVWSPNQPTSDDLILTRIIRLQGTEPGINKGSGVDSYDRYIYIHGTAEEHKLGTCASHGCIRLSNSDVITLFNLVALSTPVLITDW